MTHGHCRNWAARTAALLGLISLCVAGCAAPDTGENEPLATAVPSLTGARLTSTGFFVDDRGHVMTAGHAASSCSRLVVVKDGIARPARLIAWSRADDVALLQTAWTPGLSAVFARGDPAPAGGLVFAASYRNLADIRTNGGAFANAVIAPGDGAADPAADLELLSAASFGSSGAPVFGANGLVVGVVTHRTKPVHVAATSATRVKAFLADNKVVYREDDRAQLGTLQDRASYAALLSVTVICDR